MTRDYSKMGIKGGVRRWANVPKKKRTEKMRELAIKRWKNQRSKLIGNSEKK